MDHSAQPYIPNHLTDQELRALARYVAEELRLNDIGPAGAGAVYPVKLPADVLAAIEARTAAKARGFFWVAEFAAIVGRHSQWVSDRCAAKVIHTLRGGKPWRIPLSEEDRWNKLAA